MKGWGRRSVHGQYVVDQNMMQRPELGRFIRSNPKAKYILPDTFLVEMCKSEKWEYTFRRNFAQFLPVVSQCFMSLSVQEARDLELRYGHSCEQRLRPREFTKLVRGAIEGSQLPDGNETMHRVKAAMDSVRQELLDNDLNRVVTKEDLLRRIEEVRSKLSKEDLQRCRDKSTGRLARAVISRNIGDGIYQAHMKSIGAPFVLAERLKHQRSMCLRWCYMLAHNALAWAVEGGIESADEQHVLNDVLDQDYVLVASFFTGVLSLEHAVRNALVDLRFMLQLPQSVVEYH